MPLAGTRRRTPDLAATEEIAAAYRSGPLRIPKGQAAGALEAAADALGLPARARLLARVLLDMSPAADWSRAGSLIGVWPSLQTLIERTGLPRAGLSRAQADLRDAGLVAFRDSGNYKRWGRRDGEGALVDFRGFDLSPIAARHGELVELAAMAKAERRRWSSARTLVTERRRAIQAALAEAAEQGLPGPWDELEGRYRALEDRYGRMLRQPTLTPLDELPTLEACAAVLALLDADVTATLSEPASVACEGDVDAAQPENENLSTTPFVSEHHIESTTQDPAGPVYKNRWTATAAQHSRDAVYDREEAPREEPVRGLQPGQQAPEVRAKGRAAEIGVPIALVQRALPVLPEFGEAFTRWSALVRTAHRRFSEWTQGSQRLWREGEAVLGPNGAALAFGIVVQKHALGDTAQPAAYFAGIVRNAHEGRRCDLGASIRGLAERGGAPDPVPDRAQRRQGDPGGAGGGRAPLAPHDGRGWRPRT